MAYGLKYAPIVLLRSFLAQKVDYAVTASENNSEDILLVAKYESRNSSTLTMDKINKVEKLLLDPGYYHSRAFVFGPCNATLDQMSDWQSLCLTKKCLSGELNFSSHIAARDDYLDDQDRRNYFTLHTLISSVLGVVFKEMKNSDNQVNDNLNCTPNTENVFKRLETIILESDRIKEKSNQRMYVLTSYLEIGRAVHDIGFRLGRKEKLHQAQLSSPKVLAVQVDSTAVETSSRLEISTYDLAIDAYRDVIGGLAEFEAKINKTISTTKETTISSPISIRNDNLKKLLSQLHHINQLRVSSELYLADVLTAQGFCYDAKLCEHESAKMFYKEANTLFVKHLGESHLAVANTLQNLGTIHFELKNWKDALNCYQKRALTLERLCKVKYHRVVK